MTDQPGPELRIINNQPDQPADRRADKFSEAYFDSLWQANDLSECLLALKSQTLAVKATGNPYLLVHLLTRTARCQGLSNQFEQAVETLNEADFVLIEAAQRDKHEHAQKHRAWLRYMIERGRLFYVTGWEGSAQNFLNDAAVMARDLGHFDLVRELVELHREFQIPLPESSSNALSNELANSGKESDITDQKMSILNEPSSPDSGREETSQP